MVIETDITIELRSVPRLLCPVRNLIRNYIASFGFEEERCQEVMLAVDEACTNAMRHAYAGKQDETLVLSLGADEAWVEIKLRDEGRPAVPGRVGQKTAAVPVLDALEPGGLGVQLIYEVFDEAVFAPGEHEGNCVTMRLKRPEK